MGLRNCPDCGTQVSTKAYTCPKCARVFKEPEGEGCFMQTLNLGCLIVLVLVAFVVLAIIFS